MLSAAGLPVQYLNDKVKALSEQNKDTLPEGVTAIALPKEFKALAVAGDSQFFNTFMDIITPLDRNLTTFARLPGVFETVLSGASTVGTVNEKLSQNQDAAVAYYVLLAVHAMYCSYLANAEQKQTIAATQNIYKLFEQKKADEMDVKLPANVGQLSPEAEKIRQQIIKDHIQDCLYKEIDSLNAYLEKVLQADKTLREKYEFITVCHTDNTLWFKRKDFQEKKEQEKEHFLMLAFWKRKMKNFWNHVVTPLYSSGVVAAVAFWLLWIGAAATTGIQLEGIAGVGTFVSLGIPTTLGLANLASYYYNAYKYGGFDKAREKAEADADFNVVMKALLLREHERDMDYLTKREQVLREEYKRRGWTIEPTLPKKQDYYKRMGISPPEGVLDQPVVKGSFTLVSNAAGNWGGSQSLAWYGKVLLETACAISLAAPLIGTVAGAVMVGLAGIFGIANGYQRYKESKALQDELVAAKASGKPTLTLDQFQDIYNKRLDYLKLMQLKMQEYKKNYNEASTPYYVAIPRVLDIADQNPSAKPKTLFQQCKAAMIDVGIKIRNHPLVDAWDLGLTGIFIGRVGFATAGIFLPFTPLLLTGVPGVCAILAVGLVYVGIKWYEKYQQKKEARIKESHNKLEELEGTIQKAELVIKDINMSEALHKDDVKKKLTDMKGYTSAAPEPSYKKLFQKGAESTKQHESKNESEYALSPLSYSPL